MGTDLNSNILGTKRANELTKVTGNLNSIYSKSRTEQKEALSQLFKQKYFNSTTEKATIDKQIEALEDKIKDADLVFTGEGGTDFQTKYGKTPFGVAQIAKKYNLPVISLAGYLGQGIDQLYDHGFTAIFGILGQPSSLQAALENGSENIERTTENIMRLILKIEQ